MLKPSFFPPGIPPRSSNEDQELEAPFLLLRKKSTTTSCADESLIFTRIRKILKEEKSAKKWSNFIESTLFDPICLELQKHLPIHRPLPPLLKKLWRQHRPLHPFPFCKNESADHRAHLEFMIRENLRSWFFSLTTTPNHHNLKEIADHINASLLVLVGITLEIDSLMKIIWAMQKHLLRNISLSSPAMMVEKYDHLDQVVSKIALEHLAHHISPPEELKERIWSTCECYLQIKQQWSQSHLSSIISMVLADHMHSSRSYIDDVSVQTWKEMKQFIQFHTRLKIDRSSVAEVCPLRIVQQLLALCTIVNDLPKGATPHLVKEGIAYAYAMKMQLPQSFCPAIDLSLLLFIHTEVHLFMDYHHLLDPKEMEKMIIEAYQLATSLSPLSCTQLRYMEPFIWKIIEEEGKYFASVDDYVMILLNKELSNAIIDHPWQTFHHIVSTVLQRFNRLFNWLTPAKKCADPLKKLAQKVELWALQNEMIFRCIHLDREHLIFQCLKKLHSLLEGEPHQKIVERVYRAVVNYYPHLGILRQQLLTRIWIFYKYLWYHDLSSIKDSSYDSYLKWHQVEKRSLPYEDRERELCNLSKKIFPLIPTL